MNRNMPAFEGKTLIKIVFSLLAAASLLVVAAPALAASPMLTVTNQSGSNVQLAVSNADPYSQINLYRKQGSSSLWTVISNIGSTDGTGYFSQQISLGSDGSSNPVQQYVLVNSQQSNTVSTYPYGNSGCTYNCGNGSLSLSQTSVSLTSGQSTVITGYNSTGSLYISGNTNSSVATYAMSGNQITIYGSNSGSTTMTVCSNNGCTSVYVTVTGNGGCTYNCGNSLSLSQANISLVSGQSSVVTAYNTTGSLYISGNTNSSVVSYTVSGNQISIYGVTSGSTTMTICSNSSCASVYVTVTGNGGCTYNCGSGLSLSQTSASMSVGQNLTVIASNSNGSLSVSSNSNSSVVSASVSGNTISLYGLASGSSTVTVCSSGFSICASLYVTVAGNGNNSVALSQNSVSVNSGQSISVSIYGNSPFYISSNSNSSIASVTITGNTINIYGNASGSSTISVCSSSASGCGSLYVTVNGYNGGSGTVTFSQSSIALSSGQSMSATIYGNAPFYIASNGNSGVATASISGNTVTVYGSTSGTSSISICQNSNSACGALLVTVNGGSSYGFNSVGIYDDYFTPKTITISAGTTVVWKNYGSMTHTVTADDNSFNSGNITAGATFSKTFTAAGTYAYHCIYHGGIGGSGMSGVVVVTGGSVLGASSYNNGQLVNQNGTVFIVYKNTETAFSSASVFLGLGFKFNNVISVGSNAVLSNGGYTISTSRGSHPWGSWVKSGPTIYFVHELGLVPVPDWNTFLNNGGQSNLIVQANSWDFQLPILSPMAVGDARLR